ncbi:TetR/AcrR family transcriptional regulator [Microlunatus flavus]|uniref:DNA-binding transcriptional regulator, AcrR family n=1 Tax=Microlunatus flavus TaxID=1036181 RepID=A0A1H9L5D7_9ACTN|nr:TetR/AcrR family transcriptional regulator [Microlunatus flavus]SER06616.1 DNA-binding transcriptional regulator, AcrR family [Microlunatus flavus]
MSAEGLTGRRERKKARTRTSISDAATRLFLERGFEQVTVKEIADAADVSPTTVFAHFPTKESLVFDEDPQQQADLVAAVRERPPGQSVLDALETHLVNELTHRGYDDHELEVFVDMVNRTPALREHQRRLLRLREVALTDAIMAGSEAGRTSAATLARFVLDAVDLARDYPDHQQVLHQAFEILRAGWSAD